MSYLVLFFAILIGAIQSIRSKRLIHSAIWLASVSAMLSIFFYLMGASQVAVIELSVGAGLVTVLLVFAIGVAGEEAIAAPPLLPRALNIVLILAFILLISIYALPADSTKSAPLEPPLTTMLWNERGLDVLVQIILIFAGVLGLLGLLAEDKPPLDQPMAEEFISKRQEDLAELERGSRQSIFGTTFSEGNENLEEYDTIKEVSQA
jgi:uncharacterized MnhB-related membrane protein